MAPSKTSWDDEDSDSTPPSSPPVAIARRGGKFDDEEDEDVLDDWENEEDSEVEREKAKKAAEAKAKADAEAKANHKTKSQRIEEQREARRRQAAEDAEFESSEDETEADKRARLRESEKASDLKHAEDLFSGIGISNKRGDKPVTVQEGDDPTNAVDLSSLKVFNPTTAAQFASLRETLTQLLLSNGKKAHYPLFMVEFAKQICRDMSSDQIKKVASGLTTLSNEKMREEKAADKTGKKTKAAKTKTTLNASRNVASAADTEVYDDGLDE